MEGKDGKTERATPMRRSKARRDGNLCISPEINSLGVLVLSLVVLRFAVPAIFRDLGTLMCNLLRSAGPVDWGPSTVGEGFQNGSVYLLRVLAPLFLPVMLAAIITNMAQTKPYFSTKTLKWKLSPLNPIKGVKNLFSAQSAVRLGLSLLKIGIIVGITYALLKKQIGLILHLSRMSHIDSVAWIFKLLFRISITVSIVFVFVAVLDIIYRRRKHEQSLMMTKHEVKEERKQQEQNPHVRKAQMKRMREFSLMRMMSAVPNASVVITNPTHVAVALEYDPENMDAPKVTAKGLRLVAQRIKKIARENNVPIIERPAVARSLYKHAKVGSEIPSRFFEVVAEILAYLHRIGQGIQVPI